jgi:transcriptional antiterminator Rof (Rho-off)
MKALSEREILQGAARDLQLKRQSAMIEIKEIEKKAKERTDKLQTKINILDFQMEDLYNKMAAATEEEKEN